jgi:HlyD family secretion protein
LARGQRRPNDADVLEVLVIVDGVTPLMTGLRVDVFFFADEPAMAGGQSVAR